MFAHSKTEKLSKMSNDNVFFDFVKGIVVAIIFSLGLVVLFAFILKWFSLPDNVISPVTFVIKCLSVVIGSLLAVKGNKGLVKGVSFGSVYIVIAFLIFSMLSGSFSIGLSSLLDLLSAAACGGIVGIIKVNKK